jgi:hypothetical protein
VVADFRSSQQSSRSHPGPAIRDARCATKSFSRNILHVSTFATKILPRPHTSPLQWIQRFSWIPDGSTSAFFLLPSAFPLLSPVFSRFYPQVLSIQRSCPCSRANPMIPKDHGRRGIPFSEASRCRASLGWTAERLSPYGLLVARANYSLPLSCAVPERYSSATWSAILPGSASARLARTTTVSLSST